MESQEENDHSRWMREIGTDLDDGKLLKTRITDQITSAVKCTNVFSQILIIVVITYK